MNFISIPETLLLGPLELLFEVIYSLSYQLIKDPGVSIILLSLAINLLVLPLYRRADALQEEARREEAALQPWVKHIRRTFRGDERTMMLQAYYRQNHYSPTHVLRGAVSLLLEIPFFMAAYRFLSGLTLLENVSFGPIADLARPDALLTVGALSINVLPILMTAINFISSAIFTKGFPLRDKLQLYGMALIFLVLLYGSPSGLVFYWTLNNLFSLGKTVAVKLAARARERRSRAAAGEPAEDRKLPQFSAKAAETAVTQPSAEETAAEPSAAAARLTAAAGPSGTAKLPKEKSCFPAGALLLAVLTGALIPSAVIKASPQEFVDLSYFYHPLLYVLQSFLLALGSFVLWLGVFRRLASAAGKAFFEAAVWIGCGIAVADYFFFATDTGILSSVLVYEEELIFPLPEKLINACVIGAVLFIFLLLYFRLKKLLRPVLTVALLAFCCMTVINCVQIREELRDLEPAAAAQEEAAPRYTLSRSGKNVVVIMLDRAMGELVPYLVQEKPELKELFSGFTYYSNTVSFGAYTNFATPALFGGYEYTPYELNLRSSEALKDKHNEALKLMPTLFAEAQYDVTVFDPVYANYEWIPDLSVFDGCEGIKCFNTNGYFDELESREGRIAARNRNFFCYGLMKISPLVLQPLMYNGGQYNCCSSGDVPTVQYYTSCSRSRGIPSGFMQAYNVLRNMDSMLQLTDDPAGSFLMMTNDTTHEPALLREPDYVPAAKIDNTEYDRENTDRFSCGGRTLAAESFSQYAHYQSNMAALLQLGAWFDSLRKEGVYDNTRIILVSDHGRDLHLLDEELLFRDDDDPNSDLEFFLPLLMVKDFGAEGFTVSDVFMTNADVPTLAMEGIIEDPVNPFTGNPVDNSEKTAHDQYIFASQLWSVTNNHGSTFRAGRWYSVHDDVWDLNNWTLLAEKAVLPE